jgi:hypothetical protein
MARHGGKDGGPDTPASRNYSRKLARCYSFFPEGVGGLEANNRGWSDGGGGSAETSERENGIVAPRRIPSREEK